MTDAGELERGRRACAQQEWSTAYASLSRAAEAPDDLELLALASYMLGRDRDYLAALERAYRAHVETGDCLRAARCAFWMGLVLMLRGEDAHANGWFGRARRHAEQAGAESAELGYLLIPVLLQHKAAGDDQAAHDTAAHAAAIGERFGDRDLAALATQEQGHALVRQGRAEEGLRLIDETMLAVTSGELSPIATGLIYCNTIAFCQEAYELRRAREWTEALTLWCERQPDMVAHTGVCLVHRAEIMQAAGEWRGAFEEARRAGERLAGHPGGQSAAGQAVYRIGELHRLQGRFAEAEASYREASRGGCDPQPGLALLRLAQGHGDAAAVALARCLAETSEPLRRLRLLPAYVEILLAVGATDEAEAACTELEHIAELRPGDVPGAMAAHSRGAVRLAGGDAPGALPVLRRAQQTWQELGMPYEAARTRELLGSACRALGDEDSAAIELRSARDAFAALAATPDSERVDASIGRPETYGLTTRELQVLRLVAAGKSNREIAAELVISEHTAARHVQNILAKLRLHSRTAASAFAFEHELV